MGVRNAGLAIKEARLKAGLTQEQLSEGICSVQSLSRIENNTAGVSPSTFQALMAHAGAPCEAFPTFANKTDFDCFYTLKRARFYLDAWQLQETYEELEKIENMSWADNKFYYQEWALLHCKLQFRSYCGNHEQILQDLISALKITRSNFSITDFRSLLLSITEIELFIALAQEYLYTNHLSECMIICEQVASYLGNSAMTFLEKERLLAEHAIVYSKYCIATNNYKLALDTADSYRHQMVINATNSLLYELTFLTGLGYHFTNDAEKAFFYFKTAFYSSHAIHSIYATACMNYWITNIELELPNSFFHVPEIPFEHFSNKKIISTISLHDGTYDLLSPEVITIGKLIHLLRKEQNLSQIILCQGLCNKSKLSKIENGILQPDIALTEALLQRLGISERVFSFYGNEHENKLYELKHKCIHSMRKGIPHKQSCLNQMKELITEKDTLYYQYYLMEKADLLSRYDTNDKFYEIESLLYEALHLTLPQFQMSNISAYRLSWAELSILNRLCYHYGRYFSKQFADSKTVAYLHSIINYLNNIPQDIMLKKSFYPISLALLIDVLYSQKHFHEILEYKNLFNDISLKSPIHFLENCYFYYCQALGECNQYEQVSLYAIYACNIGNLSEFFDHASKLENCLAKDFGIHID